MGYSDVIHTIFHIAFATFGLIFVIFGEDFLRYCIGDFDQTFFDAIQDYFSYAVLALTIKSITMICLGIAAIVIYCCKVRCLMVIHIAFMFLFAITHAGLAVVFLQSKGESSFHGLVNDPIQDEISNFMSEQCAWTNENHFLDESDTYRPDVGVIQTNLLIEDRTAFTTPFQKIGIKQCKIPGSDGDNHTPYIKNFLFDLVENQQEYVTEQQLRDIIYTDEAVAEYAENENITLEQLEAQIPDTIPGFYSLSYEECSKQFIDPCQEAIVVYINDRQVFTSHILLAFAAFEILLIFFGIYKFRSCGKKNKWLKEHRSRRAMFEMQSNLF